MSAKEKLIAFIEQKRISKREFYNKTGLSNGFLDKVDNIGSDKIESIISAYPELSLTWLITGIGDMLNSSINQKSERVLVDTGNHDELPEIEVGAMAGYGSGDSRVVMDYDIEKRWKLPAFKGANFVIKVSGNSMQPTYHNGDFVICKKVHELAMLQWGMVHVLDTIRGAFIKILEEGKDDEHILCMSENPKFKPFNIHKEEIKGVSLVVGVINIV